MNISSLNLNLLKLFAAIYEYGKLGDAAQQVGLSQPGASHALKQLRSAFNDELFVRGPDGFRPTEKAEAMAPLVIEAMGKLQEAVGGVQQFDPRAAEGTIRIQASDYAVHMFLPQIASRLMEQAPGMRCAVSHLDYAGIWDDLQRGRTELAIMSRQSANFYAKQQLLVKEEPVCVVCENSRWIGGTFDLASFAGAEHVIVNLFGEFRSWVDQRLEQAGHRRNVRFVLPYFSGVADLVRGTELVGTLPRRIAEKSVASHGLRILPLPLEFPRLDFVMAWHPQRDRDQKLLWIRRLIRDVCRQ